jgi:hypothetical protein
MDGVGEILESGIKNLGHEDETRAQNDREPFTWTDVKEKSQCDDEDENHKVNPEVPLGPQDGAHPAPRIDKTLKSAIAAQ